MTPDDRRQLEAAKHQLTRIREQYGITAPAAPAAPALAISVRRTVQTARRLVQPTVRDYAPPPPPLPACPVCGGAHFVRRDLPPHHPHFGKSEPCPTCHDRWEERRQALAIADRWPLPAADRAKALRPFRQRAEAPLVTEAARRLSTFVANAIAGDLLTHDLFALHGTPGTGKSHLCLLAWQKVYQASVSVIYTTGTALEDKLKTFGYDDESNREADHLRRQVKADLIAARFLILDEIDHITISRDYMLDQLLDVVNARRAAGYATLFAGNNLTRLSAPLTSRLRGMRSIWMDFTGVPDARPTLLEAQP